MFSTLKYLAGMIEAEETDNRIIVYGIRSRLLIREIGKIFGSRVERGMLYTVTMNRIEIPKFFAYDFHEVLLMVKKHSDGRFFNKKLIDTILERLDELPIFQRTKTAHRSKFNKDALSRFTVSPLPHQHDFFSVYDTNSQRYGLKGYILAAAPGTGKTLMGLYISEMLDSPRTIIFSPNNALDRVWKATLDERFNKVPSYYVYGRTPLQGDEKYLVFNHENLKFAFETIKKHVKPGTANIILDECHGFTDMKSDRTQIFIEICKYLRCQDVLFMSGTPFKAMGSEILPFLKVSDPLFNDAVQDRFKKVFGTNGNSAMPILAARIGRSSFSLDKTVVVQNKRYEIELRVKLSNGSDYTMNSLRAKMGTFIKERVDYYQKNKASFEAEYLEILDYFERTLKTSLEHNLFSVYKRNVQTIRQTGNLGQITDLIHQVNVYENKTIIPALPNNMKEPFRNSRSVYKYVALKIQGEALGRILGKERERCNIDIFKGLNNALAYCPELGWDAEPFGLDDIFTASKTKAIFFTDYVGVVQEAEDVFKKRKMKPMLVYGDTNKDLSSIIKAVETDPEANPIVATFKSLSTAVPLVMLDTCVFLNAPFRDYIRDQAESRLDRLGQKNDLMFYSVFLDTGAEPNISTRSKDILEWSKEMVGQLMGVETTDDPDIVTESFKEGFQETAPKEEKKTPGYFW